jgi:hypothetical protein
MALFTILREYLDFQTSGIAIIFSIIEFMSIRFGFEIRTLIVAFLFFILWLYSYLNFQKNKNFQYLQILSILLIGLSHIESFGFIILLEILLTAFYYFEKLITFKSKYLLIKVPLTSKLLVFTIPIIFFIFINFFIDNLIYFSWLFNFILKNFNLSSLQSNFFVLPGFTSLYLGLPLFLFTWATRFILIVLFILVLRNLKGKNDICFFENPIFRIYVYITLSLTIFLILSIIFPTIVNPARVYVFLIIPIGIIVASSKNILNIVEWRVIVFILIIFIIYSVFRLLQLFDLPIYK